MTINNFSFLCNWQFRHISLDILSISAMAAGITKKQWKIEDIIELIVNV